MQFLSNWPFIAAAIQENILEPIDAILAQHILGNSNPTSQSEAIALCHLSLAVRSGHLCVQLSPLAPSAEIFWDKFSNEARHWIQNGLEKLATNPPSTLVVQENALYFQRFWQEEADCIHWLHMHEGLTPSEYLDESLFSANLAVHSLLRPQQAAAIKKILQHTITLITGGPGTGKTYTAGCLIQTLWKTLTPHQRENFKIALAAPTGKAASQLQQSIAARLVEENVVMTSTTLHTLLNISPYTLESKIRLPHDLVLVDESSMIDIRLMTALLKALKPGARLILLGDHRQLPPVEPGAPFAEFIRYRNNSQDPSLTPAHLTECLRADLKEIVHFADAVNQGNIDEVLRTMELQQPPIIGRNLPALPQFAQAVEMLANMFPPLATTSGYPNLHDLKAFRVLSPLKKGLWGVESLNSALHKALMAKVPRGQTAAIPILLVSNDHQLKLYNGEVGFLLKDTAYFPTDGTWREVPAAILPKYQYGYCLSVHKSQGSEFDQIVVMLPQGSEVLGRAVLYTAVTRARKSLEVWHEAGILEATLRQEQPRQAKSITGG